MSHGDLPAPTIPAAVAAHLDEAIQQQATAERNLAGADETCRFVPAHEPWSCEVHRGGHRSRLDQTECSVLILRAAAERSALREAVVDAAVAWSEHPTPANIGRLHVAVYRFRGLDTPA